MARTGRPLKFKTVKELEKLADAYFEVTPPKIQTITGLAMALDTDRTTLINYENRDDFFDAIKRYKTRIEHAYELSLRERGSAGDIFGLKNFSWTDKTEVEHSGEINKASKDELRAIVERYDRAISTGQDKTE